MAAILWGPRAHHRGTGGEVREEVTRAPHKERHSTQPQLVESHGIPAFLHEMTEDVVTQQHSTRARTVGQNTKVCGRNGNCDDSSPHEAVIPDLLRKSPT